MEVSMAKLRETKRSFTGRVMRRHVFTLLTGAAIGLLASQASAADLGAVYKAPPLPPSVQDWSGVYVGVEGGWGWGKQDFNPAFDPFFDNKFSSSNPHFSIFDPTIGSISQSGGVAGAFAGVQKQWGSVVLGAEISVDWADIKGSDTVSNLQTFCLSSSCVLTNKKPGIQVFRTLTVNQSQTIDSKIDELAYAGPKVGWAFGPNWMIYATGGAAWAHKEDDGSALQQDTFSTFTNTCGPTNCVLKVGSRTFTPLDFNSTAGATMFGYAVGGGLDYKWQIDPGSAVVFGVQYLHYGFGNNTLVLADNQFGSGNAFGINTKESVDVIKGRISYFFSIH
jgi:opacity protein-like surface antigen